MACPAGAFCDSANLSSPLLCGPGTFSDSTGMSECKICPAGYYCPGNGSSSPLLCPVGSYSHQTGLAAECPACDLGFFCPNATTKEQCTRAGDYCPANSFASTPCPAGSYCPTVVRIISCNQGFFCPSGATVQIICPAGSYCPRNGSSSPTLCSKGSYSLQKGLSVACPACDLGSFCPNTTTKVLCTKMGDYCPANSSASLPCPGGSYCPSLKQIFTCNQSFFCPPGSTAQTRCPAGFYCPQAGMPSPKPCSNGTYSTETGRTAACPGCDRGYFCPNATTKEQCTRLGDYCPANSSASTLCPGGSFCPTPTEIYDCGYYGLYYGYGYYCPPGSTTYVNCPIGFYCPGMNSASPIRCSNGTWAYASGSPTVRKTDCGDCPNGNYCPDPLNAYYCSYSPGNYCPPKSTSPQRCPAGYYCPSPSVKSACQACDINHGYNTSACGGSSNTGCACNAGYFLAPQNYPPLPTIDCSECHTCNDPNSYVSQNCSQAQDTMCMCNSGFYKVDFSYTAGECAPCSTCPDNSIQTAGCYGWLEDTHCECDAGYWGEYEETYGHGKRLLSCHACTTRNDPNGFVLDACEDRGRDTDSRLGCNAGYIVSGDPQNQSCIPCSACIEKSHQAGGCNGQEGGSTDTICRCNEGFRGEYDPWVHQGFYNWDTVQYRASFVSPLSCSLCSTCAEHASQIPWFVGGIGCQWWGQDTECGCNPGFYGDSPNDCRFLVPPTHLPHVHTHECMFALARAPL